MAVTDLANTEDAYRAAVARWPAARITQSVGFASPDELGQLLGVHLESGRTFDKLADDLSNRHILPGAYFFDRRSRSFGAH
jgi:hypothetical protein